MASPNRNPNNNNNNAKLQDSQSIHNTPPSSSDMAMTEFYDPSRVHIMIVDDDVITRKILQMYLNKYNFIVTAVGSGTEAWEKLHSKNSHFDLVLTDVMMPAISGFNLLKMINDDPMLTSTPVILMSGTAIDSKTANDGIKIGGQDYLTKPIGKELLKKKLDMVLQNAFQKKKEAEYRSVLAQERYKGSQLAKQMAAKEHEIDQLKRKVSDLEQITKEALESPLQSITRSIDGVLKDKSWASHEDDIRNQLQRILRELSGSANLYRPSFENIIHNDSVDPMTKSFLVAEFTDPNAGTNTPVQPIKEVPHAGAKAPNINGGRRNSIPTFPMAASRADRDNAEHKTWEFDVLKYSESELMPLVVDMFNTFQLLELFNINLKKLHRFIMSVHSWYHKENRYHNFIHAFDVTHACYCFLTLMKAQEYLSNLDILALLIAALCHDLDHPGFNNNFQVNAQTELAIMHNDVSVLESHHACMTFKILKTAECNILENLNDDQYKEIRRSIIQLVLATDMANHFEYVSKFQHHLASQPFDRNKKEDRQMISNILIKCADLSNSARPWTLNEEWSYRVSDEFFNQSDYERSHSLPVAPFMDKTKTTRPRIAADFMDFVALPIFRVISEFLPNTILVENIVKNRQMWQLKLEALNAANAQTATDAAPTATSTPATTTTSNNNNNNNTAATTTSTSPATSSSATNNASTSSSNGTTSSASPASVTSTASPLISSPATTASSPPPPVTSPLSPPTATSSVSYAAAAHSAISKSAQQSPQRPSSSVASPSPHTRASTSSSSPATHSSK